MPCVHHEISQYIQIVLAKLVMKVSFNNLYTSVWGCKDCLFPVFIILLTIFWMTHLVAGKISEKINCGEKKGIAGESCIS